MMEEARVTGKRRPGKIDINERVESLLEWVNTQKKAGLSVPVFRVDDPNILAVGKPSAMIPA